jgi:hypothetical protein
MKTYIFCLLILTLNTSFGQVLFDKVKDREFSPKRYAGFPIRLDSARYDPVSIPGINSIEVIDARPDTFSLGYLKKGLFVSTNSSLSTYKRILFATPNLTEVVQFCNRMVKPGTNSFDIVLVVKELWLTEEFPEMNDKDNIKDIDQGLFTESRVKARFEFYLRAAEKYYAIYRFDTSFRKTLPLKISAHEHIANALTLSLRKLLNYNFEDISKNKKAATINEISEFNNSRFNLAIFKDTSFKRGVYISLEEFKNNNPSITEFEIRKGKLADALYTKSENGTWAINRSVWGYCDENKLYIKSGENFYHLHKVENSFYFQGSREIQRFYMENESARGGRAVYYNTLSPLKLNVESGKIY